jgi:hypothetical protein
VTQLLTKHLYIDFASAQPVLSYVTNPDQAENCALAQVRARSGDALVFAEYKDVRQTCTQLYP